MLLKGKDRNLFIVKEKITCDVIGDRVKMPGNGLSVFISDGVVVFSTDNDTIIPENGDEIRVVNDVYKVEVIK